MAASTKWGREMMDLEFPFCDGYFMMDSFAVLLIRFSASFFGCCAASDYTEWVVAPTKGEDVLMHRGCNHFE